MSALEITNRATVQTQSEGHPAALDWHLSQFNHGDYLLSVYYVGTQWQAHLNQAGIDRIAALFAKFKTSDGDAPTGHPEGSPSAPSPSGVIS